MILIPIGRLVRGEKLEDTHLQLPVLRLVRGWATAVLKGSGEQKVIERKAI